MTRYSTLALFAAVAGLFLIVTRPPDAGPADWWAGIILLSAGLGFGVLAYRDSLRPPPNPAERFKARR